MTSPPPDLAALTALVDRQSSDLSLYAGFLTNTLAGALPPEYVRVERRAGMFGRVKDDAPMVAVTVRLGEQEYTLRRDRTDAVPRCTVSHVVGGIVLNTRPLGLGEWSAAVAAGLADLSATNDHAAAVLSRLTGYDV